MDTIKKKYAIGIVAAMASEIDALKQKLTDVETEEISGILFYKGKYQKVDVVCAMCGIGKVFAAMCVQTMILKYAPEKILHIGVAGSLSDSLKIGDVAIASSVVQHDMDTTAIGDPPGLISGINIINMPCSEQMVSSIQQCAEQSGIHYETGVIASGDCFLNDRARKETIVKNFHAIACEMEGGSTGQVCYVNGVDFCVIRAISDNGDENSGTDYKDSLVRASNASIQLTEAYLSVI